MTIFFGNSMLELWEDMLVEKLQERRYCKLDYGGLHYSRMLRSTQGNLMYVNMLSDHPIEMNFH